MEADYIQHCDSVNKAIGHPCIKEVDHVGYCMCSCGYVWEVVNRKMYKGGKYQGKSYDFMGVDDLVGTKWKINLFTTDGLPVIKSIDKIWIDDIIP